MNDFVFYTAMEKIVAALKEKGYEPYDQLYGYIKENEPAYITKHKPEFTPNVDCGDYVIIINATKAVLTGHKNEQKMHYRHTGWIGGLKSVKYSDLIANRPEKAFMLAVGGMLPHNTLGREALKKLRVYADDKHNNEAQKPEMWTREI